jgi:hypothetical protein
MLINTHICLAVSNVLLYRPHNACMHVWGRVVENLAAEVSNTNGEVTATQGVLLGLRHSTSYAYRTYRRRYTSPRLRQRQRQYTDRPAVCGANRGRQAHATNHRAVHSG